VKIKFIIIGLLITGLKCFAQTSPDSIFQMLVQKEQTLADAIATGDKPVWKAALHDSCIITIEDGSFMTKEKIIADLNPLPQSYKGMIKVIEPRLRLYGNTAVVTFIDDEYEEVYGQHIHTQYRQTDTWIRMEGDWKMVAMELFEIPKNPPAVSMPVDVLSKYTGTYEMASDRNCEITVESGKLFAKKNGKNPTELLAETENVFFRNGDGRGRVIFIKNAATNKYNMIERRAGEDVVWKQVKP
jgi:hypothetical protein